MSNPDNSELDGFDPEKRETLRKLGASAWMIPVVATFAVGGLNMSTAWAAAANGTTRS